MSETDHQEAEVTSGEDLMQEHGVLGRIVLVYDEAARRVEHGDPVDLAVVASAARIVRRFVEDYHEKLEEQFVFPRLEAARREADLIAVLGRQHQRGREVIDGITGITGITGQGRARPDLARLLRAFHRMYLPHAFRGDTVLFPAFRHVVGRNAYRELSEQLKEQEHACFGEGGFACTVAEVAGLGAALGVGDLSRITT